MINTKHIKGPPCEKCKKPMTFKGNTVKVFNNSFPYPCELFMCETCKTHFVPCVQIFGGVVHSRLWTGPQLTCPIERV